MRRLVVFCDGTWKSADDKATTNVVKAMDAVEPVGADGVSQILFYERGVGTGNILDRLSGGIFGDGLSGSVRNGYRFLAQNYAPGDEIYLFGFSRGAYAARSLAGLLRCCGLVRKENTGRISEAYGIYRMRDPGGADKPAAVAFRQAYAQEVRIKCIGVFDTVGALGVPVGRMLRMLSRKKYGFHDTALSSKVDNAFHALAIDEGRYTFEPSLWNAMSTANQRVEQVWFAGAHSDVGGGYPESGLSDGALLWMLERAGEAGLTIRPAALQRKGNPQDTLHNETWARYVGLPGNIRDVARHPAFGERIDESVRIRAAAANLRYAPPNYLDAIVNPRVQPLRRPLLVRLLRSLLGSNAVTRIAPVGAAAARPLSATRISIAKEPAADVGARTPAGAPHDQENVLPPPEQGGL